MRFFCKKNLLIAVVLVCCLLAYLLILALTPRLFSNKQQGWVIPEKVDANCISLINHKKTACDLSVISTQDGRYRVLVKNFEKKALKLNFVLSKNSSVPHFFMIRQPIRRVVHHSPPNVFEMTAAIFSLQITMFFI